MTTPTTPNTTARLIPALMLGGAALLLTACNSAERAPASGAAAWQGPPRVTGSAIVALSDADLRSGAFYDGRLFGDDHDAERAADALTLVRFPLPDPTDRSAMADVAQIGVTNSVLGPPRAAAMDARGRFVLVLETRGSAGPDAYTMGDLPPGGTLTLVDTTSPFEGGTDPLERGLRIRAAIDVGPGMSSVALHPEGAVAAIAGPGSLETLFVRITDTGIEPVGRYRLAGLPRGDLAKPATIAFDPTGRRLAVTALGADMVSFYEFHDDGVTIQLRPWGAPLFVGNFPYTGEWTPDGRHFITSDLRWGDHDAPNIIGAPDGRLSIVRVSGDSGEDAVHERVAIVDVGVSPEGLVVHPAGDLIVTGNIGRSFFPEDHPDRTDGGSLTLVSLDRSSGRAEVIGEYPTGVAPQGLAFDVTGDHLLVTDFDSGDVQVWRVRRGRDTALVFTGMVVHVGEGAHWVNVLP